MNPRTTLQFAGSAAIVTGAASGIGLAIARELAARGTDLAIADIDAKGLDAAHAELARTGRRVISQVLDVGNDGAVADAASRFGAHFGTIHLLFNNAGIDVSGKLAALALEDWHKAFEVNVFGLIHGIRHFLPLLQQHGDRAHVVNTASGMGFWVNPDLGAYSATKYAVVAMSEALELELAGTPVGVSVLCPGPVATPFAERSSHASDRLRASLAGGVSAAAVARWVLQEIARDEFYVFTPTRNAVGLEQRTARIRAAIARLSAADGFAAGA